MLDPSAVPIFIPEVTIGGTEFDKIYYEYRSVSDPRSDESQGVSNMFLTGLCIAWLSIPCAGVPGVVDFAQIPTFLKA